MTPPHSPLPLAQVVTAVNNYDKMRKALEEIARQRLCDEMDPNDDIEQYGDFEGAYDMMIKAARAALSVQPDPHKERG